MPTPKIHPFYRLWFTTIDPFVLIITVGVCIFSPSVILETFVSPSLVPYDSLSHGPLLWQSAALYAFMVVIFGGLLRASDDLKVWRIVQGATLMVDIALLATMWVVLKQQSRLEIGALKGGDWFNGGFTIWVAVIRAAFLSGIGVGEESKAKRR